MAAKADRRGPDAGRVRIALRAGEWRPLAELCAVRRHDAAGDRARLPDRRLQAARGRDPRRLSGELGQDDAARRASCARPACRSSRAPTAAASSWSASSSSMSTPASRPAQALQAATIVAGAAGRRGRQDRLDRGRQGGRSGAGRRRSRAEDRRHAQDALGDVRRRADERRRASRGGRASPGGRNSDDQTGTAMFLTANTACQLSISAITTSSSAWARLATWA